MRSLLAALFLFSYVQTADQPLPRMVATEKAFAAATAEIGVRDGFLTFFADDSIELNGGKDGASAAIARAKDSLKTLPPPHLPLANRLIWEPFTGQMAADGTVGWLTGASVTLNLATSEILRKGAYFSVWKRQSDGSWKVWLDHGIALPSVWQDASPFRAAPEPDTGSAGTPNESLDAVERSVASGGEPWRARLAAPVRVHDDGHMPIVGRDAAIDFAARERQAVKFTLLKLESAGSDDLAFALGGYDATTSAGLQHGTWIRAWRRDVTRRWRIVFETTKAER
jgi:ketosteroid isomerase-like protein